MKKKTLKAVLIGNRGLNNILKLEYSGNQLTQLNEQMKDVKPGAVLEVTICEPNKSKTLEQRNTFHLLLDIFWKSGCCSDNSKRVLKKRIKEEYGVLPEYEIDKNGKKHKFIKSTEKYTLKEYLKIISGLIDEMLFTFQENCHYDKRFDEMIQAFNKGEK